jgi:hypothetical protein
MSKKIIKNKKTSASMQGNENGTKLKDEDVRQQAYSQYCEHLAKGKSKRSWYFEHPTLTCTWETMEKYIENKTEFDPNKKKVAECRGFGTWEKIVEDSATGVNEKANTASLQMVMRNKFGWDKKEETQGIEPETFNQFALIMNQITNRQSSVKIANKSINADAKSE